MNAVYDPNCVLVAKYVWLECQTEEALAHIFGVDLPTIAQWAWDHEEFFNAITPHPEAVASYHERKASARAKRSASRKARFAANPSKRVENAARARIWAALKGKTKGKMLSRLDYAVSELIAHLESKFLEGMTMQNYGRWHIDHIKPCALFDQTDPEQFAQCWALSNLQPMWASDNVKKGAKYQERRLND